MIQRLSEVEKDLALRLSRDEAVAETEAFQSLAPKRRHLVARTAYAYLRLHNREGQRKEAVAARSLALLRLVNKTPAVKEIKPEQPVSPKKGHGTKMIAATGGAMDESGFGEFQARLSYHDWLDAPEGFLKGATIEALNLRLRKAESDDPTLERLDVVNVRSLAPRNQFRKPVSWFVNFGLDRRFIGEKRHLTRHVQGGAGLSWSLGPFMPYGYAMARAENNSAHDPFVSTAAGASSGILWYAGSFQAGLDAQGLYYQNDDVSFTASATLNVPVAPDHAIRARIEREGSRERAETEFSLSWRYYFD